MSKLKLEVLFGAVDKLTGPMKTIVGGSKSMAAALKKTDSDLKGLQATQRKVDSFRSLQDSIAKTTDTLEKYRAEHKLLKDQSKLGPLSEEQTKKLKGLEQGIRRTNDALKSKSAEITGVVRDLNVAGIKMDDLGQSESDLKNKIHLTTMELNKQKEALSRHEKAQKKYEEMQTRMNKASELAKKGLAVSAVAIAGMGYSLKQYEDAEDAAMGLRVSMMQANGQVAKEYGEINKLANSLGTKLPGTTADFQNMMAVLIQQGISAKAILGGVGVAAGYLGVQMKMPFEEAAEFAAKMQDATKTAEKDMLSLMDVIQRGYYLGVDKGNMLQGFSKISAGMKIIKQEGLEGAKAMAPLLIMADQAAMAGESAGNAFSKIFKSMMDTDGIKKALKDSKTGLTMDFTDGKGEFGGLDNMYKQLEKLKGLSTEQRLPILSAMFGNDAETIQATNLLIDKGKAGYDEVVAKMQAQADLQTRVNAQLSTLKNLKDAAGGTFTSLLALFGEQLAPQFKSMITGFTNITENVTAWAQANPGLANTIAKVAGGAALLIGGLSAISMGLITVVGPIMVVMKSLQAMGLAMSLAASPILIALGLLAVAGYMLYKNWDEIVSGSKLIWQQLSGYVSQKLDLISSYITTKMEAVSGYFSEKWNAIKSLFSGGLSGISALIINWSPIGLFYSAFAKVLSWFGVDLPAKFTGFGAMILEGLKNGILSKVNAVKDAITGAVSGVIDKAKGILGIHSPSRVFMGIGGYTMQGMANGIANANGLPIAATSTATQGVVNTAAQTKPVKPINVGRNNPRSYISQDTIQVTIQVKDGSVVKGTAEAMRQELQRVAEEQQMKKRKFLTDTE